MKEKWTAVYIRVSTYDQHKGKDSQRRALKEYVHNHNMSPTKFYTDTISGATSSRPAFDKLQKRIFEGKVHTVVVWKLDRISRKGIKEGIDILTGWLEQNVRVVSVKEQFDFHGHLGQMLASIFLALAAMEREALIENTKRGLRAARQRGVTLGRPRKLSTSEVRGFIDNGMSIPDIATQLNCTRGAIYAVMQRPEYNQSR